MRIAIIDYGMCNLDSVVRAVEACNAEPEVIESPEELMDFDGVILPGVGAFNDAMHELNERGFTEALREYVKSETGPLLGICLGMQLLADYGTEFGKTEGLGLVPGSVELFEPTDNERIPHVGWNEIHMEDDHPLLDNIKSGTDFYFVHSYYFKCDEEYSVATTPYCGDFTSIVSNGNCHGVQFHPEKSLGNGRELLMNFIDLC